MFTHGDIKTTFACEDTALLLHRVIIAVQLVATHAQVGRATGTNDRDTDTAADAGLLRIVVIAVLLALQQQVTADLRIDGFAICLSTNQCCITPAAERQCAARVNLCFRPEGAVTVLFTLPFVGVGKNTQATTGATDTHTDTHTAAAAAVTAVGFLRTGRAEQ
ncbi:Uncharacterised protein [Yersinia massiliensis]|nr:Uncharacterised protein [Yersinia massiliensis]